MTRIASGRATRRHPRLSITTRAIRAGLFASTAALAIAGAPAAIAGTCTQTATNEVTCTGTFTDNVTNSVPLVNHVPDLTLIVDDGPSSVTPAAGVVGIGADWGGNATVINYADISTVGADGINFDPLSTTATLSTYGDITTYVSALGVNAIDVNAVGDVNVVVGGTIYAYSDVAYNVLAVTADSSAGNVSVLVDGTGNITASAYDGDAIGVYTDAFLGSDVTVDGSVYAVSTYGNAGGVISTAYNGDSSVTNTGYIGANAYGTANGAVAGSKYGNASVVNSGDISATAYAYNAIGALAYAGGGDVYLGNTGTVYADSAYGLAIGMLGYASGYASLYNAGSISASGYGSALGAGLLAVVGDASIDNSGSIDASASGYLTGYAIGVQAQAGGMANLYNTGSLTAYASADPVLGTANATGALLTATGAVYAYNSGDIGASAYSAYSTATGLAGNSATAGVTVVNGGSISATSDGTAIAVSAYSPTYVNVTNYGDISAYGDLYSVAIDTSTGLSADSILNYGNITGAIDTGAGDDYLYNAGGGVWNVGTTTSYFGAGDDVIVNNGTINMDGSSIDLGYHAVAGNAFYNNGTITLNGDNAIDMGQGLPLLPAANPIAFVNDGVLDFQDGAPDDTLTISGDFAGSGDINVDVSGLNNSSDMLYIDGNVVAGTAQTINVDLLDLSGNIDALIPIVEVSGDSVASNFGLGTVNWDADNSFVNLDFSLNADIDATNATPDVFSLGIEATGLSDPGTIAASVAPGVQSLMNTQVGTWRQRMGVIDSFNKGGVSLWARVFQDKGTFSPGHVASNFGNGGNFEWDQKNRGMEAGIDFAVTDEFSLGLLAAKSKADLSLNDPGTAEANIDADTWGVYGTWISPNGFYLDTSYRWTKFDLDLGSIAGPMNAKGKAETFNAELGYAWTMEGGLKIEPQLQYTRTNVKDVDVFTTSNGMTFHNDGGDSSRGRVGVAVRKSFGDADTGWQITPHATLSAVREFDGETSYMINNSLAGTTTVKGTSALLELGVNARHENWAVYGGLNWQDGGAMKNFIGGQLGVRYTFGGASPAPAPAPVVVAPAKTCADLDDDGDGVNNCDDKCLGSTAGQAIGPDGCPVPAPQPEPEPMPEPKPFRG